MQCTVITLTTAAYYANSYLPGMMLYRDITNYTDG